MTTAQPATGQHRGVLAAFVFSLVTVQGLTVNLMPVLFGTIARAFDVTLREQGQLQSAFLAGGMIALLISGYVTEAIGAKRSGLLAISLVGIGSLLLGLAQTYSEVLTGAFTIGLGNFWILAVYSAVITAHFAEARQRMFMWATAAFAGSATVSTVLFGYFVDVSPQWNLTFLVFAALLWTWFGVFYFVYRDRLRIISQPAKGGCPNLRIRENGTVPRDAHDGPAGWLKRTGAFLASGLFNRGTFWILGLLVILDVLAANNIVAWTGRFFQVEHDISDYQVGLMVSASSAGVFVGRLLMGAFVSGRFSDRMVLGTCYAGGILMYVLVLLSPSYSLGVAFLFLNGALIAAQAPTMYSLASAKFGLRAATAIPLVDAIGNMGGLMGPLLVGELADSYGLFAVLWLIPLIGVVFVAVVFTWEIVDRRRTNASPNRRCRRLPFLGRCPVQTKDQPEIKLIDGRPADVADAWYEGR